MPKPKLAITLTGPPGCGKSLWASHLLSIQERYKLPHAIIYDGENTPVGTSKPKESK